MDRAMIQLELDKYLVIANFLLEAMEARKEPVDLRLILFADDHFSHEELIAGVNNLAHHTVKQDPVYSKAQLRELLNFVRDKADHFREQLRQ